MLYSFSPFPGLIILRAADATGQPDGGEVAMAKFMLYAVYLIEHIPDADWIVIAQGVIFGLFRQLLHLTLSIRAHKVAIIKLATVVKRRWRGAQSQ
jgi:hypothetical protein